MTSPGGAGDPLEVAYVEVRFDTHGGEADLKQKVKSSLKDIEKDADKTATNITKDFEDSGDAIVKTYRDAHGRLRDENGRFVKDTKDALVKARASFSDLGDDSDSIFARLKIAAKEGFGQVADGVKSLANGISQVASAASTIGGVVYGIGLVTAALSAGAAAVQGFYIAMAGLAALPGLLTGVAASVGVIAAAFHGIGGAFTELTKHKSGGGGQSEADRQRAIAGAIRNVTQAQRELVKAREDEARAIERLNADLETAQARRARTADDLATALKLLEDTKKVGTEDQIKKAQIAYDEAKAAADEAAVSANQLAQDKAKADKVGVEGSDRVLNAIERLKDAQDAQAQAQSRSAAGMANQRREFNKLSASAKDFVLSLVDAQKTLKPLQQAIQEAFFKGTGDLIPNITKNIMELQGPLLDLTNQFNGIFKGVLEFLGSKEFKTDVTSALKGFGDLLKGIAPSIGPLLSSFGKLAAQFGKVGKDGKTIGQTLGELFGKGLDKISDFVAHVDLAKLFSDAKNAWTELKPVLSEVWLLVQDTFEFFEHHGPTILKITKEIIGALADLVDWLDVEALPTLKEFWESAKQDWYNVTHPIETLKNSLTALRDKWAATFADILGIFKAVGGKLKKAGTDAIKSLFEGLGATGGFAIDLGKKVANALISGINNNVIRTLNKGIQKVQDGLNRIPGVDLNLTKFGDIPALAKGGVTTQETLAVLGERGRKEGVIPLQDARALKMVGDAIASAMDGVNGGVTFAQGSIVVQFEGVVPSEAQAYRTGQAVGSGIANALNGQKARVQMRTLGPAHV